MKSYLRLSIAFAVSLAAVVPQADAESEYLGKPLSYWVAQAAQEDRSEDLSKVVQALSSAVADEDPSVKVTAADALATLGPAAEPAVEVLVEQLGHVQPWVRVAAMGAIASVGKQAVPVLIETFQTKTGGPRIRAGFVLGGIGPDAKAAVPIIAAALPNESHVIQDRFLGILNQIAPDQYPRQTNTKGVAFDAARAGSAETVEVSSDWPQYHGPNRDGICRERGLLTRWPEDGPKMLWMLEGLGRGYSTVSIVGGQLYTMGDLPADDGTESQFVLAYDLQTRERQWATRIGPAHEDGGPRCTPTVDGDRIYVLGTDSDLVCLERDTGKVCWQRNLTADFGAQMMSIWKFCESPLIDGDKVICTPGGPDAMMVALDKTSGDVIWKSAMPEIGNEGTDGAGYASAVVAELGGVRQYIQMVGRGAIGVDAETGKFLWGYNPIANTVANITSPLVRGDYVFVTTAYNTGATLLKIENSGGSVSAGEVYFIAGRDFQNHHGGVVLIDDHVFGGHGPNRGDPACVDFASGKVLWKKRAPAPGSAAVLYADGNLIFRYDRGEVVLVKASPDGLQIQGQFEPPLDEGPAWAHPVVHSGKLYLRHANKLMCYDLRSYD